MRTKTHINDAQPATVDEHFQLILHDREIIDHDFVKVTPDDLPEWFDEKLFKIGQEYYNGNLLGFGAALASGLTVILAVPDILEVLLFTRQNATINSSYKRFSQTLLLMYALFHSDMLDPNSKWFSALNAIRQKHAKVSKKRVKQNLHGIYQKDMAITQFGFLGYVFVCPEKIGLAYATEEQKIGFNHFWQVTGHLLGVSDRINICRRTVEETIELCKRIQNEILVKHLENPRPEFLRMMTNITHGLWYVDLSVNEDAFLALAYNLTGIKYIKPIGWYSYLNQKTRELILQSCNIPFIGWVIRQIFNLILAVSYWILEYYPLIPMLAFGRNNAQLCLYSKN
ncbi:uncharacterized protein LOC117235830 [Bombus vosnesenskii]|uniref:Uncharacterized protein LOC117235830 n=1 Tax=Bombus vosnesenskii TaxID=207650 RepID=A0A6J3KQD5_9HYME|nr:uncharacterized protein LOC117235830 [Bombus vosnesenskii]XP_033354084.1 uncharacterized protein LOC117235830 [Bombus vosnesenskii]XP_033354085.1 uncharacterized protein LOC117235830 [Bombus vosnesenskii]